MPVLLAVVILMVGYWWMNIYTRHNEKVAIPDLKGMTIEEASAALAKRGLTAEVIDSVYNDDAPKGTVVDQEPDAEWEVKPDRRVYLTMNASQPKMLNMPALINLSKRQAISVLDILGIKVKELQYKPDACVDCVLDQLYKGKRIKPEERIRRGESITLVLGSGEGGERVPVPDVRGFTLGELASVLNHASLNLGVVVECEGCNTAADSALARVQRQQPGAGMNNRIALGGAIDVWLTVDTAGLDPDRSLLDTLRADTLKTVLDEE
ncbi:MAG: PASTA domain-containing protein [Flavobacteriales bacterium]|nr:MAG: PASTA domain-containing protein [Flavobacteriales bacterium]